MTKARLIHELNEILRKEYGVEQSVNDPIAVRDLAILVQALKQGKVNKRARLNYLGFDLEKDGFDDVVRDRREHLDMPALIYARWVSDKGRCT